MIVSTGLSKFAMLTSLFSAAAILPSRIQADVLDLGELPNGVAVDIKAGKGAEVKALFKVVSTGSVRVIGSNGIMLFPYSDQEYKKQLSGKSGYIDGRHMMTYQCKEGDLLYLHNNMVFGEGSIQVSNGDIPLHLAATVPSADKDTPGYEGDCFSVSKYYVVQFIFDNVVSVKSASITANGESHTLSPVVAGNSVEVDVDRAIIEMYDKGTLKKGDAITIELHGVSESGNPGNLYGTDGKASVEFIVADRPVELKSALNTPEAGMPTMLSYYNPGSKDALVELTFTGDLLSDNKIVSAIQYYSTDRLDATVYEEILPYEIEGASLRIDLSGKRRRPEDMLPATDKDKLADNLLLTVRNIKGADGQYVYNGKRAAPASYTFNYGIETLQYTIASDFTPAASYGLQEDQPMEIYIMNGSKLSFTGVCFAYKADGLDAAVEVPLSELDVRPDDDNANDMLILLTVPTLPGADEDSDVIVTLTDMQCADGLDHSENVRCLYPAYTSGVVSPLISPTHDVYNTQGVCIMKQASAKDLKTLPAGIYIMDGRKIAIYN